MEDQNLMDNSFGDMRISDRMKSILAETAKWAKFLAIVGFIWLGLMAILGLFAGSMIAMMMSSMGGMSGGPAMGGGFITITFLFFVVLYFFPILYLYQFASGAQKALASGSDSQIEVAFDALRKHYRFIGILMIIILAFYALTFISGIVMASAM